MKAKIDTNRTGRILTTLVILTITAAIGYGQGLLAEGAMKIFNSLSDRITHDNSLFHQAVYKEEASASQNRVIYPRVIKSLNVDDVEISFENELKAEDWMTESFAENVEPGVHVEEWMTIPVSNSLETPVYVEDWMTTPISENLEIASAPEAWMTTPLYESIETAPELESWMTTPLLQTSEEEIQVEDWMTTIII